MPNYFLRNGLMLACICSLTACSGFFDKDNTPKPSPLVSFKQQIRPHLAWKTSTGNGAGSEYLKLSPSMNDHAIFTSSTKGTVTSTAKTNGRVNWQRNTGYMLTTGPGAGDGIVAIGSMHGNIVALDEANGNIRWTSSINGELIANPAVRNNRVIVKAMDGTVTALSTKDGHQLWTFKQSEPDLVLRGSSTPVIRDDVVIAGFANGNLASASLSSGQIRWVQQLATPEGAFAIERMIDIDADPVIYGHRIFAATYQGNIASLDWRGGRQLWSHKLSSYTGMTADDNAVFVTDAESNVWSFGNDSGLVNWRQTDLAARNISGPADMGRYVVVGDAEGYLHWLDKTSGKFAAREYLGGAILAKPLTDGQTMYVLSSSGTLAAYQLG
ncbi:MAG TPA: outer membrane protein assembly factor BamB [Gammaproteobacteria bacterium]|nr:outer membrane protein assembly factor BamB [Gammaproteobacteria bacterium]